MSQFLAELTCISFLPFYNISFIIFLVMGTSFVKLQRCIAFLLNIIFLSFLCVFYYCTFRLPIQSASSLVSNGIGGGTYGKGKSGTSSNNKCPRDSITQAYLYSCSSLTRLLSRSPEWANISEKEREKLGLTFNDDGEFW